jgi:hypothetical protein
MCWILTPGGGPGHPWNILCAFLAPFSNNPLFTVLPAKNQPHLLPFTTIKCVVHMPFSIPRDRCEARKNYLQGTVLWIGTTKSPELYLSIDGLLNP